VHLALNSTGSPVSCDTCHNGLGPSLQNLNHYNRAKSRVPPGDALFLATYNAQSGASMFDNGAALSCSNVSCHGGQATPNWRTGAIDVNTQCTSCHTTITTTQFNGPTSANHNRGQHQVACTTCHNTTSLAVNHFTTLSTPALEGPASATIGGTGTPAIISWNPTTKSCTPACHGNQNW
jgi:predicted CxxxxCH...CXXCH cytochrome family protein